VLFPWSGDDAGRSVSVTLAPLPGGAAASLGGHF